MQLEQVFTRGGLRRTEPRKRIVLTLLEANRPLSHEEIEGRLGSGAVDKVTVYRTLKRLKEANLVHLIRGSDGVARFRYHDPDGIVCPGNHVHFHCRVCRGMWCLVDQPLPWVVAPKGGTIEQKHLVAMGVCPACGEREATATKGDDTFGLP